MVSKERKVGQVAESIKSPDLTQKFVDKLPPLPEYVGRLPKHLIDAVLQEAITIKKNGRDTVSLAMGTFIAQKERTGDTQLGSGLEEVIRMSAFNDKKTEGIVFSLDTLLPRVDSESWSRYIDSIVSPAELI